MENKTFDEVRNAIKKTPGWEVLDEEALLEILGYKDCTEADEALEGANEP